MELSTFDSSILYDEVTQTKLIASVVLFAITLICGYLPVRTILNQSYVQYAMFAGAGVLMATAFCHLIPETHDNFKESLTTLSLHSANASLTITNTINQTQSHNGNSSESHENLEEHESEHNHEQSAIPYPEITLCIGFFFMYLVEQLIVRFINSHTHEHPCNTGSTSSGEFTPAGDSRTSNGTPSRSASATMPLSGPSRSGRHLYKFLRGFLIISAFGAHSIFDGVAIGSQTSVEKVWTIFLAIACHKLIIAAVVGLELYAATLESHLWTLIHLAIFSIMSPIGIILVVVAQNSLHMNSNHPAMILMQSFATGTLLYIVFIEILQPKVSLSNEKNKFGKSFSLLIGFIVMLSVLLLMHG